MADNLRARILEALNTAPIARVRDDATIEREPHDKHRYYAYCALCRGEAETLTDAVMVALADLLPDDLDAFVAEQAKKDPQFAAEYTRRREARSV